MDLKDRLWLLRRLRARWLARLRAEAGPGAPACSRVD
jgi:hypothetical protein